MSIFKSTLNPAIASQLKAREAVVSNEGSRGDTFLRYTSGKNSWVRMTSFVNYNDPKGRYTGDQLSKKYVLEGGTLYNVGKDNYNLRAGVGNVDGVYASNLDFNNASGKSDLKNGLGVDRLYGLRPMPGITSANVINKSAYGSLREATIQFYAWDKHQLEELEILFMRPGYTVFFEWGWSQYLDYTVASGINSTPTNINIKNFDIVTLNTFQSGLNDDVIYSKIDKDIEKSNGNYDAMLGYVQNFSWQLMSNGGFQCSTTLISRGEAISGIKASGNPNVILGSAIASSQATLSDEPKPILSTFEKIFLNIIASANETEFVQAWSFGAGSITSTTGSLYVSGSTTAQQQELRDQSDGIVGKISTRLTKGTFKTIDGNWDNYTIKDSTDGIDLLKNIAIKFCNGQTEGTAIEYISMNAFVAIINEFFLTKNEKTKKQAINVVIPQNTPCLASEDSVSIDPTTCIIRNSHATFLTETTDGFNPQLFSVINSATLSPNDSSYLITIPEFIVSNSTKKYNVGAIGNIYISINKIVQIYRGLSGGPDGVDVIDLMQEILDACSFALGGINDFKLYSDKNIVQIIDVKYFENSKPANKFKFDLIGLKSICRDVKINSRIFSEQSNMIAIGATSGDNANLGDVYSSTQNYFNKGLTDRIITTIVGDDPSKQNFIVGGTELNGSAAYYFNIYNNIETLASYVYRNVLGVAEGSQSWKVTRLPQSNEVVNAGSLLKTFHYQINGKDVDFKALIPFELEITLDGISGLIVGQIFVIDKSILPKDYYNKNLGFIITGVSHNLQNNDWVTVIKTQICLLENDAIPSYGVDKELLKKTILEIRKEAAASGLIMCALADYMVHQMFVYFLLDRTKGNNTKSYLGASDLNGGSKIISRLGYTYNFLKDKNSYLKLTGDGKIGPETRKSDVRATGISDYTILKTIYTNVKDFFTTSGDTAEFSNSEFIRYATQTKEDSSDITSYLKSWYEAAKKQFGTQPDFPQTYDDFIKAKNANFDINSFANMMASDGFLNFESNSRKEIFKNTIFSNQVNNQNSAKEYNDPDLLLRAWKSTYIGAVANENGGVISIPVTKINDDTPFTVQQVLHPADKTYTSGLYPNYKENEVVIASIFPAWETVGYSGVYVSVNYYKLDSAGFNDMYVKFYQFLVNHRNDLGLSLFTPAAGFNPMQYQLEKVLK